MSEGHGPSKILGKHIPVGQGAFRRSLVRDKSQISVIGKHNVLARDIKLVLRQRLFPRSRGVAISAEGMPEVRFGIYPLRILGKYFEPGVC
jgi:hypothetical protein